MKKLFILLPAFLLLHGIPLKTQAQTFTNNDTVSESRTVSPELFNQPIPRLNPQTITCGQFNDDNGDGVPSPADFLDCATLQEETSDPPSPNPSEALCVLLNSAIVNASPNQFNAGYSFNNGINFINQGDENGSLRSGTLNGGGFNDLVGLIAANSGTELLPLFTIGNADFSTSTGVDCTSTTPPAAPSSEAIWQDEANELATLQGDGERGMELFDCDGDGDLDAVTAVSDATVSEYFIHVNMNGGAGLQDIVPATGIFDTTLGTGIDDNLPAVLDVADFDGDTVLDVAFVGNGQPGGNADNLAICLGDGANPCGFACTNQVDLNDFEQVPQASPNVNPTSIEAADFDGEGSPDVAIVLSTPDNILVYLFNDGAGNFSSGASLVRDTQPSPGGFPYAVTSGLFNFDDVPDAAVTNFFPRVAAAAGVSTVAVFNSDGSGGILPIEILSFPPPFMNFQYNEADAIEAGDFDHCGGDDIVALARSPMAPGTGGLPIKFGTQTVEYFKQAHFWYNENEPPVADAGPDLAALFNTDVTINGTCSDPTMDDRTFSWTVTNQPSGSTFTFGTPNGNITGLNTAVTTTFQANTAGNYTVLLTCTDFCGLQATDTLTIVVTGVPPPGLFQTQGGCLASLTPEAGRGVKWVYVLLMLLPLGFLLRRVGKKGLVAAVLAVGLMLSASTAQALTTSFSVNSFEPTVDDSEYFTVYNSPTMLKRNFHVGFFLDYAHNPYEFGNANFDRVAGIVDSLLTGNIVGSYAVLNWMTVGVLIPVYFWEHIDSPTLGLDENNFDLGDVQLVLKFRLLDREKHHVGIAVVPFMIFPSSTGSADFLGNGSFAGGGKLVIDGRIKDRVSLALNLGYLTRAQITDIGGNNLNDQFLAGLGISIDILRDKLFLIGEAQVATVVNNFFSDRRTTPAEARVGFRYTWANNHDINVGGGFGLSNGIGSPDYRLFAGYTYTKRPVADVVVPPPPISEVQVGDELTLQDKIYFEFDKAVIRDISKPTLDKIAGFLKAHPEVTKIKIDGYTCDLGSDPYNLRLSQRRAKAAADYLIGQGIDPSRIGTVDGFGEKNPLVPNLDEPHREQNRRVQIFVEQVQK